MTWNASTFANAVLRELQRSDPSASKLETRVRGKIGTIGVIDGDDWVPLLRFSRGSASFNVMSLDVRHGGSWEPTDVRGIPAVIAAALLDPLRFTWALEAAWNDTSDPEH